MGTPYLISGRDRDLSKVSPFSGSGSDSLMLAGCWTRAAMNKHLRNYVRQQRELKDVRLGQLAEMIGYTNHNKGARAILEFERKGVVSDDLLQRLVDALEIDQKGVIEAMEKDIAEWEAWLNEPVPMQMILMPIPAVNLLHSMPHEIETSEAENYARNYAKEKGFRVCLVLSRREPVWITGDGEITCRTFAEPGVPNFPNTTVGGRRNIVFRVGEHGLRPVVVREP
jgi:hypothetical protein